MTDPISVPEEAAQLFHVKRLPLAVRYAGWLTSEGVTRGLIGPRESARIWDRHILNCVGVTELLGPEASVADVGSGAGLPGLVLAIARPDLQVTLIEPLLRRTDFLGEVATDLELDNVEIVRGRADALHGTRRFDHVTSRAVAPLSRLLSWSMPLVSPAGSMVAMKGGTIDTEIQEASGSLSQLGCSRPEVLTVGSGTHLATVVRVGWADPDSAALANRTAPATAGRAAGDKRRQGGRRR